MANAQIADRVRETTITTGTGTLTLTGAVQGHRSFSTAFTTGSVVYYCVTNYVDWEVGYGTFTTAGTTLTRSFVLSSSNSNALVNFPAGTKDVFNSAPTDLFNSFAAQTAISGVLTKSVAGGSNVTLTTVEAANGTLILTGVLTASISLIVPTTGRWTVVNTTTGGSWTVTVRTSAGVGIVVPRSQSRMLVADGTNVIDPESGLASLYLGIGANAVSATNATNALYAVGGKNATIANDTNLQTWADSFPAAGAYRINLTVAQGALPPGWWYIHLDRDAGDTVGNVYHKLRAEPLTSNPNGTVYHNTCEGGVWSWWVGSTTGSYTSAGTGFVSSTTPTTEYLIDRGFVQLSFDSALFGASNSTAFTITGMPAAIRPTDSRYFIFFGVNGVNSVIGWGSIATSGVISLYPSISTGNWVNDGSSSKQFNSQTIVYKL